MKRMASEGKNSGKSSTGRRRVGPARGLNSYVLCVKNDGYSVSLDLGKVYRCLPDPGAERHAMRRIVDESGEDYLYTRGWFIDVHLPQAAKRALSNITGR